MSFGYPQLHARAGKTESTASGRLDQEEFNVHGMRDALQYGIGAIAKKSTAVHPLEFSELHHGMTADQINYATLRATQGIHAPLRLQMEKFLVQQPTRLSIFPPSNLHLDVLNGKDETIDFEDVLNVPEYWEKSLNAHTLLEKKADLS